MIITKITENHDLKIFKLIDFLVQFLFPTVEIVNKENKKFHENVRGACKQISFFSQSENFGNSGKPLINNST